MLEVGSTIMHLQTTSLSLNNSSWPVVEPLWKLNTWKWATNLPCDLSYPSWAGSYLTHQPINLGVHRSNPFAKWKCDAYDQAQASCMKKLPNPYEEKHVAMPSVPKHACIVSCDMSDDLWVEEKSGIWFAASPAWYAKSHRSGLLHHYNLFLF